MSAVAGDRTREHVAVVVNPTKVDMPRLNAAMAAASDSANWASIRWYRTSIDDAGQTATAKAIAGGADLIVACGGDGTVRAAAEALVGTTIPLGLIPVGTGNLLARNLGLTLGDLEAAARVVAEGHNRAIDVGMVTLTHADGARTEHAFVVMAGLGLDAEMIANTNPRLKERVGWLAYVGAGLRSTLTNKPFHFRYSLDGRPEREISANGLLLANCGLLTANFPLLPEAMVDDGVLDFVAFRARGPFGWLRLGTEVLAAGGIYGSGSSTRARSKEGRRVRPLRYFRGSTLNAKIDQSVEVQLDGDSFGEVTAVAVSTRPARLTVRVAAP